MIPTADHHTRMAPEIGTGGRFGLEARIAHEPDHVRCLIGTYFHRKIALRRKQT